MIIPHLNHETLTFAFHCIQQEFLDRTLSFDALTTFNKIKLRTGARSFHRPSYKITAKFISSGLEILIKKGLVVYQL